MTRDELGGGYCHELGPVAGCDEFSGLAVVDVVRRDRIAFVAEVAKALNIGIASVYRIIKAAA